MVKWLAWQIIENARGLVCVVGAGWLYHGVAALSVPAANIAGGLILLVVGGYPYLTRPKGSR